ncbi:hemagluttinin family protein [Trypanosoma cruzi]|nr:hemagluttinin family protein [Trypanosoma cruzi]
MVSSPMRRSNHKVRINIHDHDAYSDVEVEGDGETKLRPMAPGGLKKRESNGEMKKDSHKFAELDSSEDEPSRFIPSVPPPKPPRDDDVIPLIGAVEQATEARLVAGEETSRSGPYQHLHRQPQERPPMEAQFSPSSNVAAAAASTTTTTAMGEDADRDQQWVGPFLVRGHTSRPMVNQNSPSNGTVRNGDRRNGN